MIGLGLGPTGLMLGLRPRLAPVSLALTAAAALLYRDPDRTTPTETASLFASPMGWWWPSKSSTSIVSCTPTRCA